MTWWEVVGAILGAILGGAGGWNLAAWRKRRRLARQPSLAELEAAHEAERARGDEIPVHRDEGDGGQW